MHVHKSIFFFGPIIILIRRKSTLVHQNHDLNQEPEQESDPLNQRLEPREGEMYPHGTSL